jgi:lipid-A-disaccharide synthase
MRRIGIVAGETSGDLLGSGLIRALSERYPDAVFEGIAGPRMQEAGARSLYPMERLSVMGLFEVLGRYRELARMRRDLIRHFCDNPPDVFIGVDAPDFNHVIETQLKARDIRTVHYVSPSVWAWRRYRLRKLKRSVDLMLTLFPFEARFYEEHDIPVRFVGHPLADMIPLQPDIQAARQALGLAADDRVLAILPGSRVSEVSRLADDFVRAAQRCVDRLPGLKLLVPLVNEKTRGVFVTALQRRAPDLPMIIIDGRSREVMTAADVVLLASGTAALEAMLLKKPMVVAYRLSPLTYQLARFLVKVDVFSLPNLLAGTKVVPEIIQHDVTPENLSAAVLEYFDSPQDSAALRRRFTEIHQTLQQDASVSAAQAIQELLAAPK